MESMPDRTYKSMLIPLLQGNKRLGIVLYFEMLGVLQKTVANVSMSYYWYFENMNLLNEIDTLIVGETTQRGFYIYDKRRKAKPDPEIKKYIEKARENSGVNIDPKVSLSPLSTSSVDIKKY